MPNFAANLSLLFNAALFLDRFARAREAGFRRVEFQFPYAYEREALENVVESNDVEVVLFNLPAGNFAAGERGLASDPSRRAEFRAGLDRAIEFARAVNCRRLNCLAGNRIASQSVERQRQTLIDNVRFAADRAGAHDIHLVIEFLNPFDAPGFLLPTPSAAFALLAELSHPNVRVQYDVYHAQRTEGELALTLARHLADIGHIQIADTPGRHQPGTGEINFRFLLHHLDRIGYAACVGLEFEPDGATADAFDWIDDFGLTR